MIKDLDNESVYVGIINIDELKEEYQLFGIDYSLVERCFQIDQFNSNIVVSYHKYYFGIMSLVNSKNVFLKKDVFGFFIFRNVFLIVVIEDDDKHIYNVFFDLYEKIEEKDITIARIVYSFFNGLIINDYQYIERLQEDINELDKYNTREDSLIFTSKLKQINKELLLLRNYYENIVGIGEELQMDYHYFFNKEDRKYMEIYVSRITRLSDNIALLQDLSVQSREVHQAELDYAMNKTMQFFTVITTIFMPLTLIAGWYGMNFKFMPELSYKYSYYILIILSAFIVFICIYWFKKKKFF